MQFRSELKLTFQPAGRSVYVLPGTTVFEAAARAGLLLGSPCGGRGTCGKCRVTVRDGECEPSEACSRHLSAEELAEGARLACQARVHADCVVEIPDEALFERSHAKILTDGAENEVAVKPAVWKRYLELPEPSQEGDSGDLKRLEKGLGGEVHVNLQTLRSLPGALRENDFRGTAVVCHRQLVAFESGDTTGACYGVAFDLGTTTIVGTLVDLVQGRDLAVAAAMNPQIGFGDDVISRILRTRDEPEALAKLQNVAVAALNELVQELAAAGGVPADSIYEIVIAGNTTMQHLLCGISPAALGEVPFPPVYNRGLVLRAAEVGLEAHANAGLYVFPNIGGFVGGDTVAGILAAGMHVPGPPRILVDIGTNGEIVLAHDGRLLATSTAAGPAFEGARITNGMRAADGAIEKVVRRGDDIFYNVIGNTPPAGLCGTALIDVSAELLRLGVIDTTGRILARDELPAGVPEAIAARLQPDDGHVDFVIAEPDDSKTGDPVCLYQRDVRELQLAAGAIRAGISIMLRTAGIGVEDVAEVLLAGAFGNFIRRSNARRIGLLPGLPKERIRFIGNAASMGAKAVLLSRDVRKIAEQVSTAVEHVCLSCDPEFQMEFSMAMLFPEDELGD